MPCYDDRNDCAENPETKRRLDNVTRLLCGLCRLLESSGNGYKLLISNVSGLPEWWDNHKEQDRQRLREENERRRKKQVKLNALAKLTSEEKRLLGLK